MSAVNRKLISSALSACRRKVKSPGEQVTGYVVISIPLPVFSVTKWMKVSIEQREKGEKGVQ